MAPDSGNTVRAIEHTLAILEELYEADGARVTDLAERLELSKSAVHSHLNTLESMGYVEKRGVEYDVGLQFLTFGGYVRDKNRFFQFAREGADELSQETDELVAVSTEREGENLYLYQVRGADAVSVDSHVGSRLSLHCTATGKAILAALPDDRVDEIVETEGLQPATDRTLTSRGALDEELEAISERGVAFDREERIEGMRGVGASVVHREDDRVLGAIGVTGPVNRMSGERYETDIPELLSRVARMIEVNVTYS